MTRDKTAWRRGSVFALIAISAWIASASQVRAQSDTPKYTPTGELLTPVGFETWVFVGSNLGMAYKEESPAMTAREASRAEKQVFHNVYLAPQAYPQFVATKKFPDLTVLVMEVFTAADKDPKGDVLAKGVYNGERVGLEVAVKNLHRPDGEQTPWAYYDFTPEGTVLPSAPAKKDPQCQNCHALHASVDNVWVQFYPILRKLLQ
jgi:hypothetical protein